ncbi:MAG: CBS domain-containing protein, partial [Desulfobaccales bacterium]
SQDDTVERAAQIMLEHTISGLPVVDAAGKLVGIITQSDIFRAFMHVSGISRAGRSSACAWKTGPASSKRWRT